jgi:hypothetical protein
VLFVVRLARSFRFCLDAFGLCPCRTLSITNGRFLLRGELGGFRLWLGLGRRCTDPAADATDQRAVNRDGSYVRSVVVNEDMLHRVACLLLCDYLREGKPLLCELERNLQRLLGSCRGFRVKRLSVAFF